MATELSDLPPAPLNSPLTQGFGGKAPPVWAEWLRRLVGKSERTTSGYQKIPGGIVIQWGVTASLNSNTTTAITFPVAFPTACLQVLVGQQGNSASSTAATGHPGTGNYSKTTFDLYNRASIAFTFNWLAVGY